LRKRWNLRKRPQEKKCFFGKHIAADGGKFANKRKYKTLGGVATVFA